MNLDAYIDRTLCVSSAHLPWTDCAERINADQEAGDERFIAITEDGQHALTVYLEECGWRISIWQGNLDAVRALAAEPDGGEAIWGPLANLMELASDKGCTYLVLDGDASTLPEELGAPVFDWEAP